MELLFPIPHPSAVIYLGTHANTCQLIDTFTPEITNQAAN